MASAERKANSGDKSQGRRAMQVAEGKWNAVTAVARCCGKILWQDETLPSGKKANYTEHGAQSTDGDEAQMAGCECDMKRQEQTSVKSSQVKSSTQVLVGMNLCRVLGWDFLRQVSLLRLSLLRCNTRRNATGSRFAAGLSRYHGTGLMPVLDNYAVVFHREKTRKSLVQM